MCVHSWNRLRRWKWGLGAALLFELMVGQAQASIYDTVTAWWHFDYADSGTITDPNQVRGARDWYTPGGYKATGIQGTPEWTIQSVAGPAGGQNYGGRSILFTPTVDAGGNVTPDWVDISNLSLVGSATLVTRFRFDGYASDVVNSWIYKNAFQYGDPNQAGNGGWLYGIGTEKKNLYLLFGNVSFFSSLTVETGNWYDAAVVLTDSGTNDSVEFYLWGEDGALQYQNIITSSITTNTGPAGTRIGAEDAEGNAKKAFRGAINHLAVWNRALSTAEVQEAFGYPGPLWQIGLDNNANVDFNHESVGDSYTIGQPWGNVPRAITSYGKNKVDFNFTANALQAALPYVFHLDMDGQSGNIGFSVLVNGQKLGTFTANSNTDYLVYVPAGLLRTGANTVTLQYENGTGYTCWDWMEFGGSWQVGYDDNSLAEFVDESEAPDDFYVWDPNWKHLERAVSSPDREVNLHFTLSDELADFAYLYTTKIFRQDDTGSHPIDILINGQLLASLPAQADGTYINLFILPDQLRVGDNYLTLRYQDTASGWVTFDFHRLSVFVPEPASVGLLT
ncbi:MAG TPA: hypothetical protein PK777_08275, partial [Thermoguttaceae bacterium]|nr:hypothetical protein [Thermoguttaceae bacterium]